MQEYIHQFEAQVDELKGLKLVIPDIILSVKLVKGARLNPNDDRGGTKQVFETRISQIQDSTSFLVSPCGRKGFCTVFRQKC